jgi:hypothetical protein
MLSVVCSRYREQVLEASVRNRSSTSQPKRLAPADVNPGLRNKPYGVLRVDDRRVLSGKFRVLWADAFSSDLLERANLPFVQMKIGFITGCEALKFSINFSSGGIRSLDLKGTLNEALSCRRTSGLGP